MSQHLQYKHPEVSYIERKQLCAAAKVAPGRGARKEAKLPPKQLTLHLVLDESAEEREKVRGADEPKGGGNGGESEGDGGKSKHNGNESESRELKRGEIRGRSGKGDGENSGDEESRGNRKSGEDEGESGSDGEQEGNEHQEEQGKQKMPTHPQESKF